jgi:hypothetical protein
MTARRSSYRGGILDHQGDALEHLLRGFPAGEARPPTVHEGNGSVQHHVRDRWLCPRLVVEIDAAAGRQERTHSDPDLVLLRRYVLVDVKEADRTAVGPDPVAQASEPFLNMRQERIEQLHQEDPSWMARHQEIPAAASSAIVSR